MLAPSQNTTNVYVYPVSWRLTEGTATGKVGPHIDLGVMDLDRPVPPAVRASGGGRRGRGRGAGRGGRGARARGRGRAFDIALNSAGLADDRQSHDEPDDQDQHAADELGDGNLGPVEFGHDPELEAEVLRVLKVIMNRKRVMLWTNFWNR